MAKDNKFKKGNIPWNKGKKSVYSEEHIKKLIKNHKGMKGKKHSSETIKKMSAIKIGKKMSNESKKKMSDYRKTRTGEKSSFWKGGKVKLNCSVCNKVFQVYNYRKDNTKFCSHSCAIKLRTGDKSNNWKGGINGNLARRTRINNAEGSHTLGEWETLKAQYNWTCPCCKKKEPEIKLTEDHIIPLSRGGSNNIENIQPLCLKCNMRKFTKIIKYQ